MTHDLFFIFYFLLIGPRERRLREHYFLPLSHIYQNHIEKSKFLVGAITHDWGRCNSTKSNNVIIHLSLTYGYEFDRSLHECG